MGSLGDGRDPERPVRDQALTTVDARIDRELYTAKRLPLVHQAEAIMEQDLHRCYRSPGNGSTVWYNHVKRLNPDAYFDIFDVVNKSDAPKATASSRGSKM